MGRSMSQLEIELATRLGRAMDEAQTLEIALNDAMKHWKAGEDPYWILAGLKDALRNHRANRASKPARAAGEGS